MGSRLLYQRAGIRQTNTEESSGNAEAEERLAECAGHDHGDNPGGTRAESHANANFGSAASDGVGSESIQADGGEKKGEAAKQTTASSLASPLFIVDSQGVQNMRLSHNEFLLLTTSRTGVCSTWMPVGRENFCAGQGD